ncbi:DUF3817 domain-containing protein [Corynebacterium poyangense]|uniref:DUF3817 domain-containing protein n=1 Tax=Corynebacterium poyangense TaxID=2684405 RepID=A0A7H0SQR9_9CORY|nr:DUF3817 domain-containing protein [Corynebacterium poyangense]MBZ8178229.1 DUF3817 domain-containing protein [Corynebacterium poyangense]QNQ90894.1 DUF3817 domain-containing protein [Corynebacterium poyangense]
MSTTPPRIHPQRKQRVRTALTIFSISAWVTGICLLSLVGRMIAQYGLGYQHIPTWATYIGAIHGIAFMFYLVSSLILGIRARWKPLTWLTTAAAGVVPFLSFFVEANRRKEVSEKFQLNS